MDTECTCVCGRLIDKSTSNLLVLLNLILISSTTFRFSFHTEVLININVCVRVWFHSQISCVKILNDDMSVCSNTYRVQIQFYIFPH